MPVTLPMTDETIADAQRIVSEGGLVVYPTDTVYGLGCDPFDSKAVSHLLEVKRREGKPIPVLCADFEKGLELVTLGEVGEELARRFWPGALTIVAPLRVELPSELTLGKASLGVRVPGHRWCRSLLSACGGWLTGTSANLSGTPSARSADQARSQLRDEVDLIVDGGTLSSKESTVVSVVDGSITILRSGEVRVPEEMMGRRIS
jgi:L-threonylcarbamoyladenylate synthase